MTFNDIEVGLDYEPEPGLADNGDLEVDLATLLEEVGSAAKAADTAVVRFIDELQYVEEPQMAALSQLFIAALKNGYPSQSSARACRNCEVAWAKPNRTPNASSTSRKSARRIRTTPGRQSSDQRRTKVRSLRKTLPT